VAKIIESLVGYMIAARKVALPPEVIQKGKSYARFQNPRVLALKERTQLIGDEEMERSGHRFRGLLEITMKDGQMLREHVIDCRGRPENPMSPEEVEKKAA